MTDTDAGPPLTPELEAAMRLSMVPGIGPRSFTALIEAFGSPEKALAADPTQLRSIAGIGPKVAREIVMAESQIDVRPTWNLCREHGIRILTRNDPDYPGPLSEIHDPPNLLYLLGQLLPADQMAIAIVGSRHATPYGLAQAEKLARGLSLAGLTIVSGLARGIDQAAHRGALNAGGRTIAVLGSGLLRVYPPEHEGLAREIVRQGAVLSESEPEHQPKSGSFPQRNRIVSGLSQGVIIVEAAERSGALISARLGMEQNREVFAVPGRVDSRMSRGCHQLIRDGAKLVESVEDVLEELGPLARPIVVDGQKTIRHPAELKLNVQESRVLQAISTEPTTMDEIVAKSGLPIQRVLSTVSVLQMRNLIRRLSGNVVVRI